MVYLGDLGPLLGFQRNEEVQQGTANDSRTVNVNQSLEYVTIACNLVDDTQVFNRFGSQSQVIYVLPVETDQRLNGTTTDYGERRFSAMVKNRNYCQILFTVKDNLIRQAVKLYLFCKCEIN